MRWVSSLKRKYSAWWDEWIDVQVERVWAHYWLAQWPEMEALVNNGTARGARTWETCQSRAISDGFLPDAFEEGTIYSI